jgi:hypothetical protein
MHKFESVKEVATNFGQSYESEMDVGFFTIDAGFVFCLSLSAKLNARA